MLVAVGHTLRQVQEGIDKVPHIVLFSGGKDVLQVLGNGRTAFAAFFVWVDAIGVSASINLPIITNFSGLPQKGRPS